MAKKYVGIIEVPGRVYHSYLFMKLNLWTPPASFGGGAPSLHSDKVSGGQGAIMSHAWVNSSPPQPKTDALAFSDGKRAVGSTVIVIGQAGASLVDADWESQLPAGESGFIQTGGGGTALLALEAMHSGVARSAATFTIKPNAADYPATMPAQRTNGRFDKELGLSGDNSPISLPTAAAMKTWFAGVLGRAIEKLGTVEVVPPDGQPAATQVPGGYMVRPQSSCKIRLQGPAYVDFVLPMHVYHDTDTGVLSAGLQPPMTGDDPDAKAYRARNEYEKALSGALVAKASGRRDITWPSAERPPETLDPGLAPSTRSMMDNWWENVSSVRREAIGAQGPSVDEAYEAYRRAGGTKSKEDWLAAIDAYVKNPTGTGQAGDSSSSIGTALGYAGDKLLDGLSWLGRNTVDLLKSWGPAGVAGAYATVKGTDAAVKGKWLPALAVGGIALLLLR